MIKLVKSIIKLLIIYMPGDFGIKIRKIYYSKKLKSLGKNVKIGIGVEIEGCEFIEIGDNVRIDKDCIIHAGISIINKKNIILENSQNNIQRGTIYIGDEVRINSRSSIYGYGGIKIDKFCVISESSKIFSSTHIPFDIEKPDQKIYIMHSNNYINTPSIESSISIGENSFLAVNSILFPGCSIGKDSFVMPNSILKDSFKDNSYIGGNPASRIKDRFI